MADHRASFANSLFGAKLEFPLYLDPCGKEGRTGFQIINTAREFPLVEDILKQIFAANTAMIPEEFHLNVKMVHKHLSFPIPNIWQASMMNEDFWTVHVAKYGIRALQVPKLVATENRFHPAWSMRSAQPATCTLLKPRAIDDTENVVTTPSSPFLLGQVHEEDTPARLLQRVRDRRQLRDRMRDGWYLDICRDWTRLPHGNIDFREDLRLITEECFVRRSEFDESRADAIARKWIDLPKFLSRDNVSKTYRANAYMCCAIGLAIMAALPARNVEKRCPRMGTVDLRRGAERWKLSKEAKASKVPIKPFETWWADEPTPDFVLLMRHQAETDLDIVQKRIRMLKSAEVALKEYESQVWTSTAVSRPLRVQIRHSLHVLQDCMVPELLCRRAKGNQPKKDVFQSTGPRGWLDMFFRLSDYVYENPVAPPVAPVIKQPQSIIFSKKRLEETPHEMPNPESERRLSHDDKAWWSVGEVADHVCMADLWVLVWDGRDYLVYDVTCKWFLQHPWR